MNVGSVIFEFLGGRMNGRVLEGNCEAGGGEERNLVAALWLDSRFGHVGHHFHVRQEGSPPAYEWYEVVGRIQVAEEVVVLVEFRPDPRD